ncbi:g4707 [Coccomyxa viridis]|uniref:G4707 protein n=1 Tax=Coccomyxa viridis TaxID=1274662 RepID=A0ABP1FQY3_9CHLO
MRAGDELAPFDRRTFNPALVLWKAIADVPASKRSLLLQYLLPRDIERVWRMSGEKYWANRQDILIAMGPEWSIWDDLPSQPNEVVRYRGRAAVPLPGVFGGFSKVFFVQPDTFELYGRVEVQKGPLGDLLYPLYFRCNIGPSSIPATGEVSDMQLEYLQPEQLKLQPSDLPQQGRWPHIRAPKWPFSGDLVDHVRAVGPGVYVGWGWKAPREQKVELGRRFLPFILVRDDS